MHLKFLGDQQIVYFDEIPSSSRPILLCAQAETHHGEFCALLCDNLYYCYFSTELITKQKSELNMGFKFLLVMARAESSANIFSWMLASMSGPL